MSLAAAAARKARESARAIDELFSEQAEAVAGCAGAMAEAFAAGHRLFAFGAGGGACDAEHIAVEFCHPIVEKRRPLPAQALPAETAYLSAVANDEDFALVFARQLELLARPGDIAVALSTSGKSASVRRGLEAAGAIGMLRVGLTGGDGGHLPDLCDHCFVAPSYSIHRIQECHEVLYHTLWDLVHVTMGAEDVL